MAQKRRWSVGTVLMGLGLVLAATGAPAQETCTPDMVKDWRDLRKRFVGIQGRDPHPIIAPNVVPVQGQPLEWSCPTEVDFALDQDGRAADGVHSWVFAAPCKLTVCGEPQRISGNYRFPWIWGEYDVNNDIKIDEAFARQWVSPRLCIPPGPADTAGSPAPRLAMEEPRLCFPETTALHVEITPPEDMRDLIDRMWRYDFDQGWRDWRESLFQRTACAYGPFVADTAHAALAEIHPAQMYWWNERKDLGPMRPFFAGDGPFALFLIQDASNRYSQVQHFVLDKRPPEGSDWRPWAYGPLEGIYEMAFWSPRDAPPQFTITPYSYEGETSPSPPRQDCTVEELKVEGSDVVFGTVCNEAKGQGGTTVEVSGDVLCECDPDDKPTGLADEKWCPTEGLLSQLTLHMRAGGSREWREGYLAIRLSDSRPTGGLPGVLAGRAPVTEVAQDPAAQVTWKAVAGRSRESLGPATELDPQALKEVFAQAGWPSELVPSITRLYRLGAVDLTANVAVPRMRDEDRNKVRVTAKFDSVRVSSVTGSSTPELALQDTGDRTARLRLESLPADEVFRIDVAVDVIVYYPGPTAEGEVAPDQETPPERDKELPSATWMLWSHRLDAEDAEAWHGAARALCGHHQKSPRPQQGSSGEVVPRLDLDLQTVVHRVVKDGVVSITELSLLAGDVERLCASPAPTRSRRVQSR